LETGYGCPIWLLIQNREKIREMFFQAVSQRGSCLLIWANPPKVCPNMVLNALVALFDTDKNRFKTFVCPNL
jgi:hypothetical protein